MLFIYKDSAYLKNASDVFGARSRRTLGVQRSLSPTGTAFPRLVLLMFAAGSDVASPVVLKVRYRLRLVVRRGITEFRT